MALAARQQELGPHGQAALPVALLAIALLAGVGVIARWGQASVANSRAQAAADAAALATLTDTDVSAVFGVTPPDDAAAAAVVAGAGGELVDFTAIVSRNAVHVEVTVQIDGQLASAAAETAVVVPIRANEGPGG